ncbi:MAG TPA: transporter substrate-binding domain-containing protein [Candidatus Babeliales bacterium]|nr:transporter substrate-binding domain-containing protein [Candidatus Babeliales bacterium]
MIKNMIKNFMYGKIFLIIVVIGIVLIVGILALRSTKKSDDTLVVGMMSGWAPFMSITNNGEYEGFDVDCAQELAKRMNKKLVIKDLGSVASCFIALEQNKIDMIFSGLDITQARLKNVAMVQYTGEDIKTFNVVFWDETPQNIRSMEDFRDITNGVVCVESGSSQEAFLDKYPFIEKKRMNSVVDIILDLRFGKSVAAILEPRIARQFAQKNPALQTIDVVLPQECITYGCGIAIKKENPCLVDITENVITSMKNDGLLEALELRWKLGE